MEPRNSDHNSGEPLRKYLTCQIAGFAVRPEPLITGGKQVLFQGKPVYKDATGQKFVIVD